MKMQNDCPIFLRTSLYRFAFSLNPQIYYNIFMVWEIWSLKQWSGAGTFRKIFILSTYFGYKVVKSGKFPSHINARVASEFVSKNASDASKFRFCFLTISQNFQKSEKFKWELSKIFSCWKVFSMESSRPRPEVGFTKWFTKNTSILIQIEP